MTAKRAFPIPLPAPDSLPIADACTWYRYAVPRISATFDEDLSASERLEEAWSLKSRLRLAAALALYDQELVPEFFAAFPLPTVGELIAATNPDLALDPDEAVLDRLLTVSESEKRAFPGTLGEAIGMRLYDGQRTYVMSRDGWSELFE